MTKTNRKIGLALGGGGARGIAHIHALKALDRLGLKPENIAGSSIGALIGSAYASGMNGAEIEDYFIATFSNRAGVLAKIWNLRPRSMRNLVKDTLPRFGQFDVEKVLQNFLPPDFPGDFSALKIDFKAVAADYYGNRQIVLERGNLTKALAASAAVPVLFKPVIIDGTVLIDGGIVNPVPFDLVSANDSLVVAIDVVGLPKGKQGELPNRIDVGFGASQLLMQSINNLKLAADPPDLFLRPAVDDFKVLDFLKTRQILKATKSLEEETMRKLEKILTAG